jgi:hypothetical protein
VKKVKLSFAKGLEVEFVNRERAVENLHDLSKPLRFLGSRSLRLSILILHIGNLLFTQTLRMLLKSLLK